MFYRKISDDIKISLTIPQYAHPIFDTIEENRAWLKQWLTWPDMVQSPTDVENFIKTELLKFQQKTGLHTTIFYKEKVAGVLGFNDIHHGIGRAGYWLSKSCTGKGIITACLKELIHLGFSHYPIERIEIHCAESNIASRSVPMRLNFELTNEILNAEEINEQWVNHTVYSLIKADFYADNPKERTLAEQM